MPLGSPKAFGQSFGLSRDFNHRKCGCLGWEVRIGKGGSWEIDIGGESCRQGWKKRKTPKIERGIGSLMDIVAGSWIIQNEQRVGQQLLV
jgi:hypothetical protein